MSPFDEKLLRCAQIFAELGVELAVLFGSRATGHFTEGSDWDIGLWGNEGLDLLRLSAELGAVVGGAVDLVNLRRASPVLCMAAVQEGKVLLDRSGSRFAEFASLTLRRYNDTAKLRTAQKQSLRRFVAERIKA